MPALQILARLRNHVTDIDRFAGLGVRHQTGVSLTVLEIEHLGKGQRSAAQRGMIDRRADLVAADPDFTIIDKPAQKLFAGACWHPSLPIFVFVLFLFFVLLQMNTSRATLDR